MTKALQVAHVAACALGPDFRASADFKVKLRRTNSGQDMANTTYIQSDVPFNVYYIPSTVIRGRNRKINYAVFLPFILPFCHLSGDKIM